MLTQTAHVQTSMYIEMRNHAGIMKRFELSRMDQMNECLTQTIVGMYIVVYYLHNTSAYMVLLGRI
jgi:hypothetical protein